MSKKHFIALANAIKAHNKVSSGDKFSDFQIAALAQFCKSQNPEFKADRWIGFIKDANGPSGDKVRQ